ncbi:MULTISPECIES: HesA/MoeB/ThiF family protein [Thiorhodovibrio]|uniref:HesA/MoeB/ThiF family protein n=1 Tax=Thiorhodovibrio TaxID=61593 RepID=UPI001914CAC6|nr:MULTISPECIES: molybdopterin-synthase adenylyltransferase MoeB [Thiorhodovibrio]MBK5968139.1 molybdopterin-synthase adenylyltransferase MoeB [Thiorhodovibrio winogradskyi]WPL13643.1 Molybdopterin-synthase adenylyltransferase [Thiorhodovibrio litoralis]
MPTADAQACPADDAFLLRYQRQILLPEFGIEGQQRLARARVLVLGLGGLGSPVALYLAAAGVGTLLLADHDQVDASNLQRQILHTEDGIGSLKTDSAVTRLRALNPATHLIPLPEHLDETRLRALADEVDLIVDASDNFATRFAANRASVAADVPLVSGAAIRAEGQVSSFSGRLGGPCYRCLYSDGDSEVADGCAANGVIAPVVGIIGSLQACEAMKILSGFGTPLFGRLLLLDARSMHWREIKLNADPRCPVCATPPPSAGDPRA